MALGIAVAMVFITGLYRLSGNPIPHKSEQLFYVQMDSWDPEAPWNDDDPTEPPSQLTYMDAMAIMESDVPTYKSVMFKAELTVLPGEKTIRPYREIVRMCYGDFFRMFDVPFEYGGGWDALADEGPEAVVVIDGETNRRLFGGEDSTGRLLRIEDRDFRIVGVMKPWLPSPKFYDTLGNEFALPEPVFMPFQFVREFEVRSAGSTFAWKQREEGFEGFLQSEHIWIQAWVQLDDDSQKEAFMGYLNAYVAEQKKLGRFGRPLNNRLRSVMEWLRYQEVVPEEVFAFVLISMLFLLVCSVNLIGILLGKFLARAPEVGVRRALGASRRQVFLQHLIECQVIGVLGGILGLGLTVLGLRWVESLFTNLEFHFAIDWNLFLIALALASIASMVAGVYPAWRICRIEPALHLKAQ
jgi:putative ABC transport system permease protein